MKNVMSKIAIVAAVVLVSLGFSSCIIFPTIDPIVNYAEGSSASPVDLNSATMNGVMSSPYSGLVGYRSDDDESYYSLVGPVDAAADQIVVSYSGTPTLTFTLYSNSDFTGQIAIDTNVTSSTAFFNMNTTPGMTYYLKVFNHSSGSFATYDLTVQ